jgi:inosine-uridine nucleoside N-ribohydrolase
MAALWIDTDVALGAPSGDVDDGFALAALLAAEVELLGISAVAGNTDAESAYAAARVLRDLFPARCEVPVLRAGDAAARISALPAGAELVALGPLANVAAAVRLDPELPRRCTLRVVGTIRRPWRVPHLRLFHDLNFRRDGGAARALLRLPWRELRVFPLDTLRRLKLGAGDLGRLRRDGGAVGTHLANGARRWLRRKPLPFLSRPFPVWDLVAALDAAGLLPAARFAGNELIAFDELVAKERLFRLLAGR